MTSDSVIWTFRILAVALAVGAVALVWRGLFHDRARGRRRCPRCWYEMTGVSGLLCPECGRVAASEARVHRTRRHVRPVLGGALLALMALICPRVPQALRDPWLMLPGPVLLVVLQFYDDEADRIFSRTAGLAQGGASLSAWERMLLARACGRSIRDRIALFDATNTGRAPMAIGPFKSDAALTQSVIVLGTLRDEARTAVPALDALLKSRHPAVRLFAAQTLAGLGPVSDRVAVALDSVLADEDPRIARTAVTGLAKIGRQHPVPLGGLIRLLSSDARWQLHYDAVRTLGNRELQASPAAAALERVATQSPAGYIRLAAGGAIRRVEPPGQALIRLRRILESSDAHSRVGAARAIQRMGAVSESAHIAQATRDGAGRIGALGTRVLAGFGDRGVPHLASLATDRYPDVAVPAIWQLAAIPVPPPLAIHAICRALSHPDAEVRMQAISALRTIGPPAADALSALEDLASGADHALRSPAQAAIQSITAQRRTGSEGNVHSR